MKASDLLPISLGTPSDEAVHALAKLIVNSRGEYIDIFASIMAIKIIKAFSALETDGLQAFKATLEE